MLNWLNSTALNLADIARRLGLSRGTFRNKLHNTVRGTRPPDAFTPDELRRLESIRLLIVAEIGNSIPTGAKHG